MNATKVALVTGASSGFGQATAALLAAQGFLVFGTSRAPAHNEASSFELLPLDVRSETSVQTCVQTILGRTGRIDLLVNNAGFAQGGALEETSLEFLKLEQRRRRDLMKSFWSKHSGLRRVLCTPVVLLSVCITVLLYIV